MDNIVTPILDKSETTDVLQKELLEIIYEFSRHKFKQRLVKKQCCFETEVFPHMKAYAADNEDRWTEHSEERHDYEKFQRAARTLCTCFNWAKLCGRDEDNAIAIIKKLAPMVMSSALEFRGMLEDDGDASRIMLWERETMCRSGKQIFSLRRYFSKVFSLSYHIDLLLTSVAYSSQMGRVLDKLIIKPFDCMFETTSFEVSEDIIRGIVTRFGTTDDKAMKEAVSTIIDTLSPALLLRHHHINPAPSPFNYVGVSKLSCYPCYPLFHAYNNSVGLGQPNYFTKGCHSKVYPQWVLPKVSPEVDSSIRDQLVQDHFGVALKEWLMTPPDKRCRSDSTDVSTTSRETSWRTVENCEARIDEIAHAINLLT